MTRTLMTPALVVLALTVTLVGCGKSFSPAGPTSPLPISSGEFTLTGTVVGEIDGALVPLEGVTVTASNLGVQGSTVTDRDGDFAFAGLTAGQWTIALIKDGYADRS